MSKEIGRREFLGDLGRVAMSSILAPSIGLERTRSSDYSFPHGFLLPKHISINSIGLSEDITNCALTGSSWVAPESGLASPADYPYRNYRHIEGLWNTTYIFGHSDFRGQPQVAKNFERIEPGSEIILDESYDKITGERIENLTYLANQDGFVIADMSNILKILYREGSSDWRPRLILQTSLKTDQKGSSLLLDKSSFGRSELRISESVEGSNPYLCLLVIADLAK